MKLPYSKVTENAVSPRGFLDDAAATLTYYNFRLKRGSASPGHVRKHDEVFSSLPIDVVFSWISLGKAASQ